MSPRNRLVTRNSRAVSVCVSPSFSQNLSGTRAASRLLLLSSSNLFATGSAARRSPVQFSIRYCGVLRSHDQQTPPAVRFGRALAKPSRDTAPVSGRRLGRGAAAAGIALLMAIVGGCAAPRTIVANESERQVSVDQAFVSLGPSAPPVLSIVEQPYENATRQTVRLATRGNTRGENTLRVDVIGIKNPGISRDATLPDAPLEAAQLSSEAEDALPGVPLRTSLTYLQNRSGPFGYAVGKSAQGDECIYAWQRVATPDRDLSVVNSRNTLSVRLRLCEPHTSEAALVATMMGLNVNVGLSGGAWTREPKQLSPQVGSPGAIVAPPEVLAAVSPVAEQPAHPPRRHVVRSSKRDVVALPIVAPSQNLPPSDSVIVPAPAASPISTRQGPVVPAPGGAKTPAEAKP